MSAPVDTGLLLAAVNALDEGIVLLDAEGVVTFLNETALRVLRVEAEDVVGYHLLDIGWSTVDEHGTEIPRERHPSLRALDDGEPHVGEILSVSAPSLEGDPLVVEASAWPMRDAGGALLGSVSVFRDVTDRQEAIRARIALQQSEQRLRSVISTVQVGIFQADAEGRCVLVNESWCRIAGLDAEKAEGDGWTQAVHPEDRERVWAEWNESARKREPFRAEFRYQHPDGTVRWVVSTAVPLPRSDDIPDGFIGSVTDVTEAKEASLLKDQLIGMVSHELRAPLVAMGGALQYLEPEAEEWSEQSRRLLDIALRNTRLLTRLVSSLLDIERAERGALPIRRRAVRMSDLLTDVEDLTHQLAEGREIQVSVPVAVRAMQVMGDRDRILQILINLISNALAYSPDSEPVTIGASVSEDFMEFCVEDRGIGVAPEMRGRIFDMFTRVGEETEGAGLGLAIVKALVDRHGGRVWVEDGTEGGSTFRFTLPLWPDD